jgi:hypothetical protein
MTGCSPRLRNLRSEAGGIVSVVAYEGVAENQDLVWNATASEVAATAHLEPDILAVRVVLGTAVGNDDRYVLQRTPKLTGQFVQR